VRVVVLAGGTGGAKLAAGLQEVLGDDLSVIANTGDDVQVLGVHVSPDPDLITYWLCDEIDAERGWGIRDDSFTVFERLKLLGAPEWFGLSDRDLATCLRRTVLLDEGVRLTDAQAEIATALGVQAAVLPMSDQRVRTRVATPQGWLGLQEFLVREHGEPPVSEVEFEGTDEAAPTPDVLEALAAAELIVIGPSNPVISIGPILAVPGLRTAIQDADAKVVAVSPFVAGEVVKGPTHKFMEAVDVAPSTLGLVELYGELVDGFLVDAEDPDPPRQLPTRLTPTLMSDSATRRAVAEATLEFGRQFG
jgi:LPPG:FO 2-phospho-L-lactate transferase